jgi:alanine racemase
MSSGHTTPAIVEISLDNLIHNLYQVKGAAPASTGIIAVVKDNAYGCGAVEIARSLEAHDVRLFAVANGPEARALRMAGIRSPILLLGVAALEDIAWGADNDIHFSCTDLADLSAFMESGKTISIHLNIDTGMGRLGIGAQELSRAIDLLRGNPRLVCEGIYTHLAKADNPDTGAISRQLIHFRKAVNTLSENGIRPPIIHYGNSAAIMRYPLEECTFVRPGITLYGCKPDPCQDFPLDLKPILSLKSHVVKIKRVPAGTAVSYGGRYVTTADTSIATIAAGYGQGIPRILGGRGGVLVGGKRYTIAGTVTMDFIMIDTGADSSVKVGDEAVIIGCQGAETISPDEVAAHCNTIAYEILCNISSTIDRYYVFDGKTVHHEPGRPF